MPPAGVIPRPRARVTFGRSPKSDQKACLKPQVSRLPARLTAPKPVTAYPAKTKTLHIAVHRIARRPLPAAAPTSRTAVRWFIGFTAACWHAALQNTLRSIAYFLCFAAQRAAPTLAAVGGKCAI